MGCWPGDVSPQSPLGQLLSRHAERAVQEALRDTRVVLVNGARQGGKSTLVQLIGNFRIDQGATVLLTAHG